MAPRRCRYLSVTLETLLHDPELLILAPTPATPGVHDLQPLNLKTILRTSHKVSLANTHNLRQAVFTGGIRAAGGGRMEIVTTTGRRIIVGADVNARALARVVAVLEAR